MTIDVQTINLLRWAWLLPGSQLYGWLFPSTLGLVLGIGLVWLAMIGRQTRERRRISHVLPTGSRSPLARSRDLHFLTFTGPRRWLAIRSQNQRTVMTALGLHDPYPCCWIEGLSQLHEHQLVLSPPIQGWILVMGPGLPEPAEDIDHCFHFLQGLSRQIGHVQFFSFNRAVFHHAWVKMFNGQVIRAFAWAGETLWNQGHLTSLERKLGMRCPFYGESFSPGGSLQVSETQGANLDKIPQLAVKWSLDPFAIDDRHPVLERGIAGKLLHPRSP